MTIDELLCLAQLSGSVKSGPNRWTALCPAHSDSKPSLSISTSKDGTILIKCHAGCKTQQVCEALNIELKDLFVQREAGPAKSDEPIAVYQYTDEFGRILFEVCRFYPKRFAQRVPTSSGYRWNLDGVRRVPYNLEKLTKATFDTQIFIPEGEKDCDRLSSLGLLASCNPGGAGKWRVDYNRFFTGRPVVILPDNDSVGTEHARQIVEELLPVAKEVKLVTLDDLPSGGDISDWLDTGGTLDGLMLRVREAQVLTRTDQAVLIIKNLSEVVVRSVDWLWPNRFPMGKLSLVVGDPNVGKSFLSLYISARVTNGLPWPDGTENTSVGNVILLSAEDDIEDTIVPRLIKQGADLNRIVAIEGVTKRERRFYFNLARDLPALERAIIQTENMRLVVIDPIAAFCGMTDSHKNAEVRGLLGPLAQLAAKYRVAVLGITHLRKGEGSAQQRVLGSIAFVAAARAVWLVTKDQTDEERRLLTSVKCNLAFDTSGLAFRLIDGQVCFDKGTLNMSCDDALQKPDREEQTALEEATNWLREMLRNGKVKAQDIFTAAKQDHIAERTLRRASSDLKIRKEREGFGSFGTWSWQLPENA